MLIEKIAPTAVAKCGGFLRRTDDVGKENRREHPVDLDWRPSARQKFLNCIGDFIGVVPDHRCVVYPRQLDIAYARNILGEKSAALYIDGLVIGSVNYEGGAPGSSRQYR